MHIFRYCSETSGSFVRHQMRPNPIALATTTTIFYLHLYLENMNDNIIFASTQLGVLRGTMRNETVQHERTYLSRKLNYCYLSNPICGALQEGNIRSQYQNRCSMVSGLLSHKKALVTILDIHSQLQWTCGNSLLHPILKASQFSSTCA